MSNGRPSWISSIDSPSFTDESELLSRLMRLESKFTEYFDSPPDFCVRSPGRAEIIGNHTDYNAGFALGCAISSSIVALVRRRSDSLVVARSTFFPESPIAINLSEDLQGDAKGQPLFSESNLWGRYVAAVAAELLKIKSDLTGMDLLLDTSIPMGAGVSSSAALEVAVALALQNCNGISMSPYSTGMLCMRAENGPLVGTPCGFLDQASVVFSKQGALVLFDFLPVDGSISLRTVPAEFASYGLQFVVSLDSKVRRDLGQSGYPARRSTCEASLSIISKLIDREIDNLRGLRSEEFRGIAQEVERIGGATMRKRVEHVVFENERVIQCEKALISQQYHEFGHLLTASGNSAIELYSVDEDTPELTFLVEQARSIDGVLGTRNMGGGFAALSLSLVEIGALQSFERELSRRYHNRWDRNLQFLPFTPSHHAAIL